MGLYRPLQGGLYFGDELVDDAAELDPQVLVDQAAVEGMELLVRRADRQLAVDDARARAGERCAFFAARRGAARRVGA